MRSHFSTVSACAKTSRHSVRTVCDPWSSASALKRRRLWLRSHSQPFSTLKATSSASHVQHDFAGARRPGAIALDALQAFQETANINQQPGEFGAYGVRRLTYALPSRNDRFGHHIGT